MDHSQNMEFLNYLSSVVNLDTLEKLTDDMDKDISESQKMLDEVKNMFNSIIPIQSGTSTSGLSDYLESEMPNLLLPDMCDSVQEIDIDKVVADIKKYVVDLQQSYSPPTSETVLPKKDISNMDIDLYASSLDQLSKRLENLKLTNREEVRNRNPELEGKLTLLCNDVNNFTQVIQTKTKLVESNKTWPHTQQGNDSLQYDEMITKLLSGVNEVTYLLQQTQQKKKKIEK